MEKKNYEKYLGKNVVIGVPHLIERRPFFHYGKAIEITDNTIVLETDKGLRTIQFSDILQLNLLED